jgi:hypothetical protein
LVQAGADPNAKNKDNKTAADLARDKEVKEFLCPSEPEGNSYFYCEKIF